MHFFTRFLKYSTVQFVRCHASVCFHYYYSFSRFLYKKIHLTNLSLKFQSFVASNELDVVLPAFFYTTVELNSRFPPFYTVPFVHYNFQCFLRELSSALIIILLQLSFLLLFFNTVQSIGTLVFQCFSPTF